MNALHRMAAGGGLPIEAAGSLLAKAGIRAIADALDFQRHPRRRQPSESAQMLRAQAIA